MIPSITHKNRVIRINHAPLVENALAETYLTSDAASGGSSLTVKNITGLAISQVLLIGELGEENAEIILVHASSAPSGTTVTLASNLVRSHVTGTRIRVLAFNQFELSHATTTTGSKTVLTVSGGEPPSSLGSGRIAIDPTNPIQEYQDTEYTSGYYFARYYHSVDTTNGSYSDAIEYGGWASNTVGYLIDSALKRIGKQLGNTLTREFFFSEINECLRGVKGKQLRWPEHSEEDYILGQTSRGINTVSLPTDIYDNDTNKSITGIRIGDNKNLTYLDPEYFENQKVGVRQTQVRTQASAASTTLEIDNSYDFEDSGTVNVYVSNVKYSISYTGVTRSATAGVLTGIPSSGDGSISVTIPVDTNVWQNETEGTPEYFTVRDGVVEFWPLCDATEDNQNIYLDYDKVATEVDSEGDEIDLNRFDLVLDYITWKAEALAKNDGKPDMSSAWYLLYKEKLNDAIRTSISGKKFRWVPNINKMSNRGSKSFITNNDRRGV